MEKTILNHCVLKRLNALLDLHVTLRKMSLVVGGIDHVVTSKMYKFVTKGS